MHVNRIVVNDFVHFKMHVSKVAHVHVPSHVSIDLVEEQLFVIKEVFSMNMYIIPIEKIQEFLW